LSELRLEIINHQGTFVRNISIVYAADLWV